MVRFGRIHLSCAIPWTIYLFISHLPFYNIIILWDTESKWDNIIGRNNWYSHKPLLIVPIYIFTSAQRFVLIYHRFLGRPWEPSSKHILNGISTLLYLATTLPNFSHIFFFSKMEHCVLYFWSGYRKEMPTIYFWHQVIHWASMYIVT